MEIRKPFVLVIKSMVTSLIIGSLLIAGSFVLVRSTPPTQLEQVLEAGELRVVSSNGPTTYYEGPNGLTGFEYSLVKGFADSLGVRLVIEDESNLELMLTGVESKKYHFAAAGLTALESRHKNLSFADPFMQITQQLVYNSRLRQPSSIEALRGKEVLVIANSSHTKRLDALRAQYPDLLWREVDAEMIDLLELVNKGEADYAVVDSSAYDLNRYSYPKAKLAFDVSDPQDLAWAFPALQDDTLFSVAQRYLSSIKTDGTLAKVTEEFFDRHIQEVTTGEAMALTYRLEQRLPQWLEDMKASAAEFDLDWQLLAAISYQESHWKADARSHTGVRGLMMLTKNTAKAMGIKDREDPQQSIYGGAKYLRLLLDRLPQRIEGDERLYFALAAYNQGLGHLEDARVLTERMGGNPSKWDDVRKHMPLLSKHQYYSRAKHGYMRGWEPVKFVDNVLNYHKIIAWHQQQEEFRIATTGAGNRISLNTPSKSDDSKDNQTDNGARNLSVL
ncbi:membrane-bound lytic murein transglycosylase MltF [Cellvibrio sp. QJXJ]|jgi:membrane-bound lytic murein transglycosylase F|uniref:membrane-bound lytic murein transglycosylase MltF n=1 Tax=Cellvibrio sp. QJXJ TaxID=2964606 RepID=UPI0021C4C1AB|nr:membrane-bound lytic murein transglycosylase MltF [Cellvibrio sp. QJXJ]UUA72951.1 membrane-bound lytic murein transglycosylase MltF [Cellvibrio sp. QJXJ]